MKQNKDYKKRNIIQSCILTFSNQLIHPQKISLEKETNDLFIIFKNNFGQRKTRKEFLFYLIDLIDEFNF